MKLFNAFKCERPWRSATITMVALGLLASSVSAASFTATFPFQNRNFQQGSLRAVGTCVLRNGDGLGYDLSIDFRSGNLGAEAIAYDANGNHLATVADRDFTASCLPPTAFSCRKRFQSAVDPARVNIFVF